MIEVIPCSVELVDAMGNDTTVVNAARVSLAKSAENYTPQQNERLIKYLAAHGHFTPFTHVIVALRLVMPVWLARQAFKSTIGSTKNETSRRYVKDEIQFHMPEWRTAPTNGVKQGSGGPVDGATGGIASKTTSDIYYNALAAYNHLLAIGVASEQARTVLPQGMMVSYIDTGSLYYWARVFNLRSGAGAQRDWLPILDAIDDVMDGIAPLSWKCLTDTAGEGVEK